MLRQCRIQKRDPKPGNETRILADHPPRDDAVEIVLEALDELGADRQLGYGVLGDIPTLAIRAWCSAEGLDADATRIMLKVIRFLDGRRNEKEASKRALDV